MNNDILTPFLHGIHTCSHISFALHGNYPSYRNNLVLYGLLTSTDAITHLLMYKYLSKKNNQFDNLFKNQFTSISIKYIYLFWFYWHIIKSLDQSMTLRRLTIVNLTECFSYIAAIPIFFPNNLWGLAMYSLLKKNNFIW
jgi:hypothetical protein